MKEGQETLPPKPVEKTRAPNQDWRDEQVEIVIGNLLRIGVLFSAAVVFIGGIIYLFEYGNQKIHYHTFRGEPPELRSVTGVIHYALQGHGRGIIQLGLLLLVATPIARVIFSIYAFIREKDRLYVVVTLIVLAILLYSLIWGHF
ncbi:DUF1634 domain-containing protein [Chthonomonas calidirosea]|uniref:Predicted membrane protein n=1 Tax=Chthonomonas calidirosea (strain DSM 23976 / ICMP 18418 / T49) TaxID=1303518 RepID=S0EYS1_CHTCT|nr:DUF1634 domain-containing protein [Chthonomonas calidirosea]CCW35153.1 Predicted membrane protein [Chthonomonas calidirosea T49]CEK20146.1 predicted membrane protein [Chthonomonas calidirosea]CEK20830.1 predicted membrane protein [Chthonomonas calidirosea]